MAQKVFRRSLRHGGVVSKETDCAITPLAEESSDLSSAVVVVDGQIERHASTAVYGPFVLPADGANAILESEHGLVLMGRDAVRPGESPVAVGLKVPVGVVPEPLHRLSGAALLALRSEYWTVLTVTRLAEPRAILRFAAHAARLVCPAPSLQASLDLAGGEPALVVVGCGVSRVACLTA